MKDSVAYYQRNSTDALKDPLPIGCLSRPKISDGHSLRKGSRYSTVRVQSGTVQTDNNVIILGQGPNKLIFIFYGKVVRSYCTVSRQYSGDATSAEGRGGEGGIT